MIAMLKHCFTKPRECFGHLWYRIKHSDIVDWMFGLLFFCVGVAVVITLYVAFRDETKPFTALSYVNPIEVYTPNGSVPSVQVDGMPLPSPSITIGDAVAPRFTRVMDCRSSTCPKDAFGLEVTLAWQRISTDGQLLERITVVEDMETFFSPGVDYVVGEYQAQVQPISLVPMPEAVQQMIRMNELEVSAWRVEGFVQPLLDRAERVVFFSEVIHVYNPAAGGQ